MSSKDNPCRKFQANIFNKSKCQNCFKPRESHLLNDEDLNQAKPIYGGWLLLAPEGTNFDNPLHRSRKWQRRFFILYEHGLLRYALDEMPSTLPQGTINMNQCSDVIDGESRTGQKNSLCVLTPDKEHFIRAECKEIINGWQEALTVYPRTNKQNQKKKRKVDPPTHQVMHLFTHSIAKGFYLTPSEEGANSKQPNSDEVSYWWHCVLASDGGTMSTGRKVRVESGYFSLEKTKSEPFPQSQPPNHLPLSSSPSSSSLGALSPSVSGGGGRVGRPGREYAALSDVPRARRLSHREAFRSEKKRQELRTRTRSPGREEVARLFGEDRKDRSVPDVSSSTYANLRRAKSLDRRVTESSMTWKKHWFVLTDQSLRCYKDSIAEEASELDGEIDLSTCYDVKEFPVQRNYGFQILCKEEACTLSAMTSGIRRNWIQAIMKNVRPTIAPDVTRSLADEKTKAHVMLEPCPQVTPEPSPSPEAPESDVRINASAPPSELRKSRVRERRREGRSKTFDWCEFKMERTEKSVKERADTVDLSSSFSTTSSCCSPSSSPSSLASSPISSSSLQTSSPSIPECQEHGKMEVDHPASEDKKDNRTSDVQEEIEQQWHQVETTPLREEKQVQINTASGDSDRLPAHELAALLDKELGQKQQELDRLHTQNNVLKEQLEDALGREQSARDGYVLQNATPPSSSPHRVPWQCLHKLNQDLHGELETQKHKRDLAQQQIRTLKRSYTEAQDAVDHHEAGIQALQAKLASAMAEILASEHAVARMRNELKLEQQRSTEQEEEYGRGEATLRAQLKDSEDRLRDIEASLLERNQALRHLERQQALQRDHMREIQRLQERLQEVTARLSATEEGQALKEERLRREQHSMQESHESERQNLCRRLAEAESAQKEMESRQLEAEQHVEALLRGRQASGGKECREEMLKLQEELAQKTDMVESLRESMRRLEEEKGHLTCRCQELLNQIAEADREVNKLRNRLETEEADYYTLEHSYERATQEFQKISQFLREKEEEIRQTKEMYERLVERKEEDLKEALIKMAALGSSLEETEQKLQAKEELLCQMSQSILDKVEPCGAEKDLKAKLVVAKDRIAELEHHLNALQLGYADLRVERQQIPEQSKKSRLKTSASLSANKEVLLSFDNTSNTDNCPDDKESQAKRPRIRFSSIQCQKYINLEGLDTSLLSGTFADMRQKFNEDVNEDIHVSEGNISSDITLSDSSDPEKFICIIHSLETKLLATEDKLRNLTQNLEEQRSIQAEGISKTDLKMTEAKPNPAQELCCESGIHSSAANKHYAKALVCVENSREKVRIILSGSYDTTDSQLHSLSDIENDLFNASLYIQQGHKTLEEQSPVVHQNQTPETLDKEALHLFAKTLSFEAVVLNKMALLIQTSKSDILQSLAEIWEDMENIKKGDKDCLAIVYADVLTRKLMLESSFCKELEKAETDDAKSKEGSVSADADVDATVIFNTIIKAELAYSIQNLKLYRQLAGEMPSCGVDSIESLQNAHDSLANELQRQAAILHKYAQEIERGEHHPGLAKMICALLGHQTSHSFTGTSLCMREALIQAQVAYVACRLRALHAQDLGWCKQTGQNMGALVQQHARNVSAIQEKYETSLQDERQNFTQTQELNRAEKGRASTELALMETTADSQRKLEVLLVDMGTMEERSEGHVRKLEEQFEQRICELQHIHKQEIEKLNSQYMEDIQCIRKHQPNKKDPLTMSELDSMVVLKDRVQELEAQMSTMRDELENKHLEGDVASLREKYQRDFESLKATCERGFTAMEDTHQKVVHDLQRQHQREISKLMEERERLLAEETAATIAAIEAMKNAHREELEKTHRSQLSGVNSDIDELRLQYEEELQSIHRELEVLSEQYSQKCLENAHLAQALEAERQALRQCQRENQELNAHNQELNNRLTTEITRMRSCFTGEMALSPLTKGKDVYELEVLLRIKESEIQYLKQEIHSLKDELQSALKDKKYATDKYKNIYTELSIVKAKTDCDISKLKEKLLIATEALGERTVDGTVTSGYDIMKSKSNPDFLKKERSTTSKLSRGIRSKVSFKLNKIVFPSLITGILYIWKQFHAL
uniref:Myosin phosphatase Rho interacting protein n=1 Tax=Cyclopterus lumpus TaxID=8103 RepID=A0A8C2Z6N2_CYCLU